jgi:ribose transport system ATP-binding protein
VALAPESRRDPGLSSNSVGENLILGQQHRFSKRGMLDGGRIAENAQSKIATYDIRPPLAFVPARTLSGGNQQKIVIGKWLAHGAKLFIFDEPTVGVDGGKGRDLPAVRCAVVEGRRHHPDLVLSARGL